LNESSPLVPADAGASGEVATCIPELTRVDGKADNGNSHLGRVAPEALTRRMGLSIFGA
jgi:glutaminase